MSGSRPRRGLPSATLSVACSTPNSMSYRNTTEDSTKKWLLIAGAAGLVSAAAAAYFYLARDKAPAAAKGRARPARAKAAGRGGKVPSRPASPTGPIKLPSMRFFSMPEGPPGTNQPGDPLPIPADYHDLTLSPVWWYTRLYDLFDCDLDDLKTLHQAIKESGRPPTAQGPDGKQTLYIPNSVVQRAIELARADPSVPQEHLIILLAMSGHDAESLEEKIAAYEAAYEVWKQHPLRKKKRVMEMFFLMALAQATSSDFEKSTGYLNRLRKLAIDAYGEKSLQVVSTEREAAVALHLAGKNDEAEALLRKCMDTEEELVPVTATGRWHILLTGYISFTRFLARVNKIAESKKYSENIIKRAIAFHGIQGAWPSIEYALEIIGQLSKASSVRLYLAKKWLAVLGKEKIELDAMEIIKLHLHIYSALLYLGRYQEAIDAIAVAEKEIINLPPTHRGVQGIVLGMNKAVAVVQGRITDLYDEAQQHLSAAMQLSKMLPQTLTIINLVHWMALMDDMGRAQEAAEIKTLLPPDLLQKYKESGVRGLWRFIIIGADEAAEEEIRDEPTEQDDEKPAYAPTSHKSPRFEVIEEVVAAEAAEPMSPAPAEIASEEKEVEPKPAEAAVQQKEQDKEGDTEAEEKAPQVDAEGTNEPVATDNAEEEEEGAEQEEEQESVDAEPKEAMESAEPEVNGEARNPDELD